MSERQSSTITEDGVRLAYKVAGEGPRNLLLMHDGPDPQTAGMDSTSRSI